jgi:NADH dehydrogenase
MQESSHAHTHAWLITGANGNLGKRLIGTLLAEPGNQVTAVVRSSRAKQAIESIPLPQEQRARLQIRVLDYTDVTALHDAAQHCTRAVHLVGILKESKAASYTDAHEASTAALLEALQGTEVQHLTYLSIVGSAPDEANACLASKGRAEVLCLEAALPACVLRVPMVLGEGDYASFALAKRAHARLSFSFRAASQEQPIYAGDVVAAINAAAAAKLDSAVNLGGPEVLTRRALTQRAAQVLGRQASVVSLPLAVGFALAGILSAVSANPPFTRDMLEVLDHDDAVAPEAALRALGMNALTPLDDMLAAVLQN